MCLTYIYRETIAQRPAISTSPHKNTIFRQRSRLSRRHLSTNDGKDRFCVFYDAVFRWPA